MAWRRTCNPKNGAWTTPKMHLNDAWYDAWTTPRQALGRCLNRPKWPRFFVICVLKGILVKMESTLIPIVIHSFSIITKTHTGYMYIYLSIHSKHTLILNFMEHTWVHYFSRWIRYGSSKVVEGTTFLWFSLLMGAGENWFCSYSKMWSYRTYTFLLVLYPPTLRTLWLLGLTSFRPII